jgi:hypothetical protein
MIGRSWSRAVILATLTLTSALPQVAQPRIYSNVEYNEEGGDLLGVELEISNNSGQIKGNLKIYEGGCAAPIAVTGSLTDSKIEVSGTGEGYGKVELTGRLVGGVITGMLRVGDEKGEKVRLKRIQKGHCQNSRQN